MSFQTTVKYDYGFGLPGEIVRDGPLRSHPGYLNSGNAANNVFGRAFTQSAADGTVAAGGTGVFFGILINPKAHASQGGASGPLSPSFALPNNTTGEFAEMAKLVLAVTNACPVGTQLQFAQADGQISAPATPGTADAGNTLMNCIVDDYKQTAAGGLVLARLTY